MTDDPTPPAPLAAPTAVDPIAVATPTTGGPAPSFERDPRFLEAIRLHDRRQLKEAEALFRSVLRDAGDMRLRRPVPALLRVAGILIERGDPERAFAFADEAATLAPDDPLALNLRGMALGALHRRSEAEAAFRAAIARDPDFVEAIHNLGRVLADDGRHREAAEEFRRAIALAPGFTAARHGLSAALREGGHFREALQALDQVIAAEGETPDRLNERGILLFLNRRPAEAVAAYDRALAAAPQFAPPRFNRSISLLLMGDLARGWEAYEHRFETDQCRPIPFAQPRWNGEPVEGRTIVLWGEQGHGDTLHFVRYAPMVARRGATVALMVQRGLVRLLQSVAGVDRVVAFGQPVGRHDLHCPLLSLPRLFGTTLETIPADVPYLAPDAAARARWAGRFPPGGRKRVGLVWAGAAREHSPMMSATDQRRSVPLEALMPLFVARDADFVSLQHGPPREELARSALAGRIADPMAEVADFADTAAIVEQLDLVITVDTAVAHLAGALGKPVWVLSRHDGCWRWLEDRDDTPWYPTMRLFRQSAPGEWGDPIARAADALLSFTQG
ncbi:MAG: tetratricopeptide repeat protein [Alphaproteobacteria bacterium]